MKNPADPTGGFQSAGTDAPRLLVVDDEEQFRTVIAKRLAKRGLSPRLADSGEACLEIMARQTVDVVVLDVKMPGINGLEVLQHIKEHHPGVEVILLTGHAATEDGVAGMKAGAYDYLTKPIEIDHLAGKIRQAHEKIVRASEQAKEKAFRRLMEQRMVAAERLASVGTLAAGIAHEINNPLAVINDAAGWLRFLTAQDIFTHPESRRKVENALEKIEKSVLRAQKITHHLLGFVRRSSGSVADIELNDLFSEAAALVEKEARQKDVVIHMQAHPVAKRIRTDADQLLQVLINLLTNAIHATPAGGRVQLETTPADEGFVQLTVADTGAGISRDDRDKIFEPFFSTKAPGEGTGLGLFVSRNIIENLGGTMDVESEPGVGSCFRLHLPRSIEAPTGGTERK